MTSPQQTFMDFWLAYPRKRAKIDAEKAWKQVTEKRRIPIAAIFTSLEILKQTEWRGRKPEYIPYPASFLRGESFDEDNNGTIDQSEPEPPSDPNLDAARRFVERQLAKNNGNGQVQSLLRKN